MDNYNKAAREDLARYYNAYELTKVELLVQPVIIVVVLALVVFLLIG